MLNLPTIANGLTRENLKSPYRDCKLKRIIKKKVYMITPYCPISIPFNYCPIPTLLIYYQPVSKTRVQSWIHFWSYSVSVFLLVTATKV